MSNPQSNSPAGLAYGLVTILVAIATVMLGFYLVPAASRDLRFGLALGNLVASQAVLGLGFVSAAARPRASRSFIAALAGLVGRLMYVAAAVVLILITLSGAGERLMVVLHVLLLLAVVAVSVAASFATASADAASGGAPSATQCLAELKASMRLFADRARALPASAAVAQRAIALAAEDLHFTYATSDVGSAAHDAEVRRELEAVDAALIRVEAQPADAAANESVVTAVGRFRAALSRRNDGIKSRR